MGAQKGGGPKVRADFSSSRLKFHSLSSLWASSRGISVVFVVLGPSKMHVWSSLGHRVRALAARSGGAAGVSHDEQESPNALFGWSNPDQREF